MKRDSKTFRKIGLEKGLGYKKNRDGKDLGAQRLGYEDDDSQHTAN